jgi:uncharacterized protein with HEPN domain
MNEPRDGAYLQHIRDAIASIETYITGLDEPSFQSSQLIQDAVIRQLMIIGEAAKRLSADFKTTRPNVPWRQIAGMRDKLVHDYLGVDLAAVWDTATIDLPALKRFIG